MPLPTASAGAGSAEAAEAPGSVQSQPLAPSSGCQGLTHVSCCVMQELARIQLCPACGSGGICQPRWERSKGHPDPCARPGCLSPAPQPQQAQPHHFLWHPPKGTAVGAAPREEPALTSPSNPDMQEHQALAVPSTQAIVNQKMSPGDYFTPHSQGNKLLELPKSR